MPLIRKRRAPVPQDDASEDDADTPQPQTRRQPQNQRPRAESPDSDFSENGNADSLEEAASEDLIGSTQTSQSESVKRLVRLALSSEHSRQVIRRQDISAKVLAGSGAPRSFRAVFDAAQLELRHTFGMELVELPAREKVTVQQRRKAQQTQAAAMQKTGRRGRGTQQNGDDTQHASDAVNTSASSKVWILTSVLPVKYRIPEIIPPARIPTTELEAAYAGLCTFVVSLIYLSQGSLAEPKLERYLRRTNAEQTTPVERTDRLLIRMAKDGYIVKIKDSSSGDEVVEYMVGPRGKVEIGEEGVKGMTKSVYLDDETPIAEEELDRRLAKSLRVAPSRREQGFRDMERKDADEDDED